MNLRQRFRRDFGKDLPISGGMGRSLQDPIVVHRVGPNDFTAMEYAVLQCLHGTKGVDWKLLRQSHVTRDDREFDIMSIEVSEGAGNSVTTHVEEVYFDVTHCLRSKPPSAESLDPATAHAEVARRPLTPGALTIIDPRFGFGTYPLDEIRRRVIAGSLPAYAMLCTTDTPLPLPIPAGFAPGLDLRALREPSYHQRGRLFSDVADHEGSFLLVTSIPFLGLLPRPRTRVFPWLGEAPPPVLELRWSTSSPGLLHELHEAIADYLICFGVAPMRELIRQGAPNLPFWSTRHGDLNRFFLRIEQLSAIYKLSVEVCLRLWRRRRRSAARRVEQPRPKAPNEIWAMNFMHYSLGDGKAVRVLTVADTFTRECVVREAARSSAGAEFGSILEKAGKGHEWLSQRFRVNNGTEFTSKALDAWVH